MTVTSARMHHIALTVRDLDASVTWYEQVFDVRHQMDAPHEGGLARLLADETWGLVFALHRHDANEAETFLESRTGLDHLGLSVPSRDDLVAWQAHLESHGVVRAAAADQPLTQSAIADEPYGSVLVFRDPENIQLEMFAPPAAAE